MNTLFCPKCYRNLTVSEWESDSKNYFYRCAKDCCEVEYRKSDSTCLSYNFSLEKFPYHLAAVNKEEHEDIGDLTVLYDPGRGNKTVIEIKQFIPIDVNKTLPSQAEHIVKRLKKLIIFK